MSANHLRLLSHDPEEGGRLFASSKEFLSEALTMQEQHRHGFAVLHSVTTVELLLKARLSRIHSSLLRANIDKPSADFKSVMLSDLPARLATFGVGISADDLALINLCAEWRHSVVHHTRQFADKEARAQISRLLDFIARVLWDEFRVGLQDVLPVRQYRAAEELIARFGSFVEDMRQVAALGDAGYSGRCPRCGLRDTASRTSEAQFQCLVCDVIFQEPAPCPGCEGKWHLDGDYCNDCLERAGDVYADMMSDLQRGK